MRTSTASTALALLTVLAGVCVGSASAQTTARQPGVPRPAPQGANVGLPGQSQVDDAALAANVWVNQVIGKLLEGPPQDRGAPARPSH